MEVSRCFRIQTLAFKHQIAFYILGFISPLLEDNKKYNLRRDINHYIPAINPVQFQFSLIHQFCQTLIALHRVNKPTRDGFSCFVYVVRWVLINFK